MRGEESGVINVAEDQDCILQVVVHDIGDVILGGNRVQLTKIPTSVLSSLLADLTKRSFHCNLKWQLTMKFRQV